jgi:hypothetical protein
MVAAPLVGALGFFSRVTEGADAATYYNFDQRSVSARRRRRREPRKVIEGTKTLPLLTEDALRRRSPVGHRESVT